jgi:O-antigen/teichoic acid export membrane protein
MSLIFDKFIGSDYIEAYNHIYILTVAIFFSSLGSLIGSILTGYKKTRVIGRTTIIGAVANVVINIIFIKTIGLYAASISTLVSYILIFAVRNYEINKLHKLEYPKRYILLLIFNLVIISFGFIKRLKIMNVLLTIYMIVISVVINKDLIKELIPHKKELFK